MPPSMDSKRDYADEAASIPTGVIPSLAADEESRDFVRPQIDYSSFGAFARSFWARWKSLWTKRFIFSIIAGQVVSLCITVTNVTTTELVSRNWSLPTTQTWFLCVSRLVCWIRLNCLSLTRYFSLFVVYTPYTIYKCARFRAC